MAKARFLPTILLSFFTFISVGIWFNNHNYSQTSIRTASPNTLNSEITKVCEYPIVYNKPPKTASTKIVSDIIRWSEKENRSFYKCPIFIRKASLETLECVPIDTTGCAILATHVILSDKMKELLTKKIGEFTLITSTRDPEQRMISTYMQSRKIRWPATEDVLPDIKEFLRIQNPWKLYNYHTGGNMMGSCPISQVDKTIIRDMVNQADIVIDADLPEESNMILKYHNIFQLSENKINVRGSKEIDLDEEGKELLKNVTCVEEEIHRLYRIRMANAYEKLTNTGMSKTHRRIY